MGLDEMCYALAALEDAKTEEQMRYTDSKAIMSSLLVKFRFVGICRSQGMYSDENCLSMWLSLH